MRSWIGATSSFGSPVMMAQVRHRLCAPSRQFSHKPAKANSGSSVGTIANGCLALPIFFHS